MNTLMKICIKDNTFLMPIKVVNIELKNKTDPPLLNYEYSGKCFNNQDGESYLPWKQLLG